MTKNCQHCSEPFEVTEDDKVFYDKISPTFNGKAFAIPEPTLCPDCRQQRRLALYNRRQLYTRDSSFSNKPIISIYSSEKPFKVYESDAWYSDKWDPLEHGRDFDFSRGFFEQFRELMEEVPLLALVLLGDNNENSDFNNDNANLKNCYLCFDGGTGLDSYYGESFVKATDCMDFLFLEDSELCYECVYCYESYNLKFSRFCKSCTDSWFLKDCVGCSNCFGCVNLHNKEYHIFNKPYKKDEYLEEMKKFDSGDYEAIQEMRKKAEEFFVTQPVRAIHGMQNENSVGDNLNHCKNAYYCFDSNYLHDCKFCSDSQTGANDSWDIDVWGEHMELCYEACVVGSHVSRVMFSHYVSEGAHDVYYSLLCSRNVKNLFGCIGLRHADHCIFNKQYSEGEYEKMVARIITHMQKTGEWGEFFSPEISAFGYNETVAQDHYPLEKEKAMNDGFLWRNEPEQMPEVEKVIEASKIPPNIKDFPDQALDWAFICEKSGKPFRVVAPELRFYRKMNLPVPHLHPDERHRERLALRNPHHLWKRKCAKCDKEIDSSFAPDRPETVYCVECYRNSTE